MSVVLKSSYACLVIRTRWVTETVARFWVDASAIPEDILPGQFFQIKCGSGLETYLRRPISVCDYDPKERLLSFLVECKGKGTHLLTQIRAGDLLDLLGPLGHGFDLPGSERFQQKIVSAPASDGASIAVLGGGCGVAPLLYLTRSLQQQNLVVFLGFRNKDAILLEKDFLALTSKKSGNRLTVATDDGSYGYAGFALRALEEDWNRGNLPAALYTCGPAIMMKQAAALAQTYHVPCQVSLEERMGCGIGACLVCACKLVKEDTAEKDSWRYGHVCKDGPAIWADEWIAEEK